MSQIQKISGIENVNSDTKKCRRQKQHAPLKAELHMFVQAYYTILENNILKILKYNNFFIN